VKGGAFRTGPLVSWNVGPHKVEVSRRAGINSNMNDSWHHSSQPPATADYFRALEKERTRALVMQDMEVAGRLHAHDYQLVTPAGKTLGREDYLAAIAASPFYAKWDLGPMEVRLSPTMAIVRYQARLEFPSGNVVSCWHTDSYELRGGHWQAVWSQATAIQQGPKV
jgi:hypothetical protein